MNTPLRDFDPNTIEHRAARTRAKMLCQQLNQLRADQKKARAAIYTQLFGASHSPFIELGFYCDYGYNIHLGQQFFANHHCVMLDADTITIGDNVLLGPNVHLYTTTHPLDAPLRTQGLQQCAPVVLGDQCWLGGNTVVMPGVTIGKAAVIGAGSIVTESIPDHALAFGQPCRVQRLLPSEHCQ